MISLFFSFFFSLFKKIENKFLDTLCGYYDVEDEDELPQEIQEISIGEMFEAGTAIEDIRTKMVQYKINIYFIFIFFTPIHFKYI